MVNGMYRTGYMADFSGLSGCGCDTGQVAASGFDFASIPTWAWIAALALGAMMVMKKGR